jgi:hypothetical protein
VTHQVRAARGAGSGARAYDDALCELAAGTLVALLEERRGDAAGGEALLCFLPGWDEIRTVRRLLAERGCVYSGGRQKPGPEICS